MNRIPTFSFDADDLRPRATSRRYRLWEVPGTVQCSIVGTCLDRRDIAVLIRKGQVRITPDATDYQIHGYFVQEACKSGPIGQLMHKALDKKYAAAVARVGRTRDAGELRAYWEHACTKGDVAGPYWALLSHRHVTEELRAAAFGDVHMLSHVMGGLNRGDARQVWAAERRIGELEERLARVRRQAEVTLAERDARIAALEEEVQQMRSFCIRLQPSPAVRRDACSVAAKLERRRQQQERRLQAARARLREQQREMEALRAEIDRLEQLPVCPVRLHACAEPAESCPLGPCRLLYVGGRPSAVPHLKTGAAKRRAELLHHDGGIEHSLQQLRDLVEQADLVFCPVDCVSHGACLLARDLCKRANKPFVPLRSASLSHFRRALDRLQPPSEETAPCSSP
ncbi:MAG: DUF2325 domain-containing protein [Pseudomonadota bacterium]